MIYDDIYHTYICMQCTNRRTTKRKREKNNTERFEISIDEDRFEDLFYRLIRLLESVCVQRD